MSFVRYSLRLTEECAEALVFTLVYVEPYQCGGILKQSNRIIRCGPDTNDGEPQLVALLNRHQRISGKLKVAAIDNGIVTLQ